MPIQPVVDPAEARRAAERALGLVPAAGATEVAGVVAGGAAAQQLGALAVYTVPLAAFADEHLDQARVAGWRYVHIAREAATGNIADVALDLAGSNAVAAMTTGGRAARLRDVATAAAANVADLHTQFDARILVLPEIHTELLWLAPVAGTAHARWFDLVEDRADAFGTARTRARAQLEIAAREDPMQITPLEQTGAAQAGYVG